MPWFKVTDSYGRDCGVWKGETGEDAALAMLGPDLVADFRGLGWDPLRGVDWVLVPGSDEEEETGTRSDGPQDPPSSVPGYGVDPTLARLGLETTPAVAMSTPGAGPVNPNLAAALDDSGSGVPPADQTFARVDWGDPSGSAPAVVQDGDQVVDIYHLVPPRPGQVTPDWVRCHVAALAKITDDPEVAAGVERFIFVSVLAEIQHIVNDPGLGADEARSLILSLVHGLTPVRGLSWYTP